MSDDEMPITTHPLNSYRDVAMVAMDRMRSAAWWIKEAGGDPDVAASVLRNTHEGLMERFTEIDAEVTSMLSQIEEQQ